MTLYILRTSSEDEQRERPKPEIPPEYWHIQKLVKYMKSGNQTATVISLCCLKDHDLSTEINQMAIQVCIATKRLKKITFVILGYRWSRSPNKFA